MREWSDGGDRRAFADRMAADGWLGVGVAEELGGQGGGVVELALTAEALGRAVAPNSSWLATMLAVPALGAMPDRTAAWLCPAEAPPAPVELDVSPDGALTGTVPRVLAGSEVSAFVVAVSTQAGLELRRVEVDDSVSRSDRQLLDRTRTVADLTLDATSSIKLDADAERAIASSVDLCAVLLAADALGAMERMLELAVGYSLQRRQFGVPIGSFQAMKHAAATIEVDVEASRSAVYYAAASLEAGLGEASLHAAAVKSQVTAAAARAADSALTMHGAIGYTWEHDLHLFYKRAQLDAHLAGTAAEWNERIARGLALVG
ncbi:alkylation response protein AidB-like acyl-CoA dehydrogenase [Nocardioides sp. BE266]|nr:alkylation response protein AidB-like acyl-CoA dehydrogenase [Nocardioides sp. BE266]